MKNFIYIFIAVVIFLPGNNCKSQTPAYNLKILNQAILYPGNAMEFDIYIEHTDSNVFEYMGGQYFIPIDPAIGYGNPLTLSIVGSDLPLNMQPRNPSIGTAINPQATLMRLAVNVFPGVGNGYFMTGNGTPGTKICRVRLSVLTGKFSCEPSYYNFDWRNPPIVFFATKIFAYIAGLGYDITTPASHFPSKGIPEHCTSLFLKVDMLIEGFYNVPSNTLNRTELITAYLRDTITPYVLIDSSAVFLDSVTAGAIFQFNNAPSGSYYVQLIHLNSIETWTKQPLDLVGELLSSSAVFPPEYDFTSSDTSAFGNNLKLKGKRYCVYSGDVNKDGVIDGTDLLTVDNDAAMFLSGDLLPCDLNGDYVVEGGDLLLCDNNVAAFVIAITPLYVP